MNLLGRDQPLALLLEAREQARQGCGRVVVVSGEAGIGKSGVAEVTASEAAAAGFAVTVGRAWELGEAPAYFGTFRNPARCTAPAGFWDGASRRVRDMLIGRDVSEASPASTAAARSV